VKIVADVVVQLHHLRCFKQLLPKLPWHFVVVADAFNFVQGKLEFIVVKVFFEVLRREPFVGLFDLGTAKLRACRSNEITSSHDSCITFAHRFG